MFEHIDEKYLNKGNISQLKKQIKILQNQINSIKSILKIEISPSGSIISDEYTSHAHNYKDNDGSDDNDRVTGGVN